MSSDPEFLDARPGTTRHEEPVGDPIGMDEIPDELMFSDEADGPPIEDPPAQSGEAVGPNAGVEVQFADGGGDIVFADDDAGPAAAARQKKKDLRSSGRMRAISASAKTLGGKGEGGPDDWSRRERSPEEDATALAFLEDQLHPAPEGDPYLGKEVANFRVEGFLRVERGVRSYLARDEESREPCLLRIYPTIGGYGEELSRLAQRAERSARVEHPGLSICLGVGKVKDAFYAAHEPPLGRTIAQLLAEGEQFTSDEVLLMLEQLSRALATLHSRQLVHGDVSINTIRRERAGCYVLCDAGLGRARPELSFLSAGGEVVGTPGFIAPETVDSGKVEPSAELYALGCVAWTMITRQPPFLKEDPVQTLLDQLNCEMPPARAPEGAPEPPPDLVLIVSKLTGYTTFDRYRNANDLIADIRKHRKGEDLQQLTPQERPDDPSDMAPVRVGGGKLVLLLLLLIDAALATFLLIKLSEVEATTFEDPVRGYVLPLPGVEPGK
ncbi:MAG TPA: hypothetical protein DEA08_02670 [Planctomycetes bacterium]|nr:hypothetical protein [Planctomycetota bacterium]